MDESQAGWTCDAKDSETMRSQQHECRPETTSRSEEESGTSDDSGDDDGGDGGGDEVPVVELDGTNVPLDFS